MKGLLLTGAFALFSSFRVLACTCDHEGEFLKVSSTSKLVVLVKVRGFPLWDNLFSHVKVAMELDVIKVYRGKELRRKITVWGDNGSLCRPYVSEFKPGRQYLLALMPGSKSSGNIFESETDYAISACGEYWLPLHQNVGDHFIVTGEEPKKKTYSLNRFEAELIRNNEE